MPNGTVVAFHAHPDDEALLDAGTLSRLVDAGLRVVLVFATRGEVGVVGAGVLADDESLAQRRTGEARRSAEAIGATRVEFLPYRDSGLAPDDGGWAEGTFCATSVDEAAGHLAEVLRAERAILLLADDVNGGYGHPDHLQVHRVARVAAQRVGIPLAMATIDREFLSGGIELARGLGLEVPEGFVPPDMRTWFTAHDDLTHVVDVSGVLDRRRASMAAHATQTTGAPDTVRTLSIFLGLPDEIFAIAFSTEWFVVDGELPTDVLDVFRPAP